MDSSYIGVLLSMSVAVTVASPPNVWKLPHLCASLLDRLGPLLSLQKQKRNVTAQLVYPWANNACIPSGCRPTHQSSSLRLLALSLHR